MIKACIIEEDLVRILFVDLVSSRMISTLFRKIKKTSQVHCITWANGTLIEGVRSYWWWKTWDSEETGEHEAQEAGDNKASRLKMKEEDATSRPVYSFQWDWKRYDARRFPWKKRRVKRGQSEEETSISCYHISCPCFCSKEEVRGESLWRVPKLFKWLEKDSENKIVWGI